MLKVLTQEPLPKITRAESDELPPQIWRQFGALPKRCDLQVELIEEIYLDDLLAGSYRYPLQTGE